MFFDARAAKLLQPGSHIVVQGCPGLRLLASQTKKTWVYRYRSPVDQSLRQIKLGGWPSMSPAQAAAAWTELRDLRETGVDPVQQKKRDKTLAVTKMAKPCTIMELIEHYATGYLQSNREPKGAKAIAQRLRKALALHGNTLAMDTTRGLVFKVLEGLVDKPVLAKSVKTEMAAAWRYAVEAERVSDDLPNWWGEKTSLKFRSKGAMRDGVRKGTTKRVLIDDELKVLFCQDLDIFSTQVADFLTFQLWTCTRGVEICQMRRSQITQEKDGWWWTIPKAELKVKHYDSAYDHRIPLEGRAKEIVARRLESTPAALEWLFASKSRKGVWRGQSQAYMQSKVHYYQPYSKCRKDHKRRRLTVTHWSPHDLRRTGRTMLAAMGCPHEVGEAIIGHVLAGVAGDYNLYRYDTERRNWLKLLSERLEVLMS